MFFFHQNTIPMLGLNLWREASNLRNLRLFWRSCCTYSYGPNEQSFFLFCFWALRFQIGGASDPHVSYKQKGNYNDNRRRHGLDQQNLWPKLPILWLYFNLPLHLILRKGYQVIEMTYKRFSKTPTVIHYAQLHSKSINL